MEFLIPFFFVILGLAPFILAIILFVRVGELARRIKKLETQLGEPSALQPELPSPPLAPRTPQPTVLERPSRPVQAKEELEAIIGGKLMNRIGALALVLGVGFFLKYAFDNNWITETMRVLIGIAAGILCLLGGHRSHSKEYRVFAQGLVGAGIAILYLSLYASFNFYHLIPQWVAFLLMSAVTAVALGQAVFYNSLAVSLLGWAGGFLTPFLLSTGESNEIALFTYVALLAVGLLAITIRNETWFVLEPLTLFGTFVVYFAWYGEYYVSSDLFLTGFFLFLFWILFQGVDIVRVKLALVRFRELRHLSQAANALLAFSAAYILLYSDHRSALGPTAFCMGILYALTVIVTQLFRSTERSVETRNGLIAAVFLLVGTGLEFKDIATIRLWALEGFALWWLGIRNHRLYLSRSGLGFLGASTGFFLVAEGSLLYSPLSEFSILLNHRVLTAVMIAAALGAGAFLSARFDEPLANRARPWLGVASLLLLFLLLTAEANDYFRLTIEQLREQMTGTGLQAELSRIQNERQLAMSGLWLLYSIAVMVIGILRGARAPRFLAIGLFGLAIVKIFIVDLSFLETLYRIFSFVGLGLILLTVSYLYQRYKLLLFGQSPKEQKD